MRQVHGIRDQCPQAQALELDDCGHSPHRDQPAQLIASVEEFLLGVTRPSK
jgi:pimeloyl-ACP methyl ester carboxylesterase